MRTGSPSLDSGLACPANYSSKTHNWGAGTSQSDCDSKYPYANSTFNVDKCETTYLHPSMELSFDSALGTSPYGNNNGLCEQGETCLHNPNIGAYAGHGDLIDSGCDVSGIITGITLKKYNINGY